MPGKTRGTFGERWPATEVSAAGGVTFLGNRLRKGCIASRERLRRARTANQARGAPPLPGTGEGRAERGEVGAGSRRDRRRASGAGAPPPGSPPASRGRASPVRDTDYETVTLPRSPSGPPGLPPPGPSCVPPVSAGFFPPAGAASSRVKMAHLLLRGGGCPVGSGPGRTGGGRSPVWTQVPASHPEEEPWVGIDGKST
jgi:hypothetical protein